MQRPSGCRGVVECREGLCGEILPVLRQGEARSWDSASQNELRSPCLLQKGGRASLPLRGPRRCDINKRTSIRHWWAPQSRAPQFRVGCTRGLVTGARIGLASVLVTATTAFRNKELGAGIAVDKRRHMFHSPTEQEIEPSHSTEGEPHADSVRETLPVLKTSRRIITATCLFFRFVTRLLVCLA